MNRLHMQCPDKPLIGSSNESVHRYLHYVFFFVLTLSLVFIQSCSRPEKHGFFEVMDSEQTGLHFSNKLVQNGSLNMFRYMYFYNGAGVAAGDFNNDGRTDLFFSSNQSSNRLFLNDGNLKFRDVTDQSVPKDSAWSTGVSVVDINNDGFLDVYVCRVGKFQSLNSKNQLLINKGPNKEGIPEFIDSAKEYGLDFSGFSTHSAFFDYDLDGDLDMYLLNHSLRYNSTFAPREKYYNTYDTLSGDRMYRNDGRSFTDVTRESGINSSVIGYGLGIAVSDINLDGYPDLYIGNDFHENDYLYINQKNGTFKDVLTTSIMHTSQFSMGVDVADINNDAKPEIISVDMLPSDPYILKRSLGEDAYDIFQYKIRTGYHHQYARNTLQLNKGNGMFSEVGLFAGVYATDWSWAPLWIDFDNDGLKDLFISNGIPKRLNDIDYVNFVSNSEIQQKIRNNSLNKQDMELINKFPEIKLPNKFYRNKGNISFEDLGENIENRETYSNGAAYADFDNDGDLDIVVNNIEDEALIYRNTANDSLSKTFVKIQLKGSILNRFGIGAKAIVFSKGETRTYENFPARGFQSSMLEPLHIGLFNTHIDSVLLIWPDNTYQKIGEVKPGTTMTITYQQGLPGFDYNSLDRVKPGLSMADITEQVRLNHYHQENPFVEFDRDPLIPHMVSREGPALVTGDVNHDGLDDVYIGSSKGRKGAIYLQSSNGAFQKHEQPALNFDSTYEDVSACFVDVNNDAHVDLVVASGGNEYYGKDIHLLPRVYLNDGKANFSKIDAFENILLTSSSIAASDFNGDGFQDLIIAGRTVSWEYGEIPKSYLLQNNGTGKFVDVTNKLAPEFSSIGFVTDARWVDLDRDGDSDFIVTLQWGGIYSFINTNGSFRKNQLTDKKGWWNFALPVDIDLDGDIDIVAGNLGLNHRLTASPQRPLRLYYGDFDGNGKKEQLLSYFIGDKEIPFANKAELDKQVPLMKKKYLYAGDFAKSSIGELFSTQQLKKADTLVANYMASAVLINHNNTYSVEPFPWQAQLSPYRDAVIVYANNDSLPDIFLGGNYYHFNIQMGRSDADLGTVLINKGNGKLVPEQIGGIVIKGEVRHIREIKINRQPAYILAKNNDTTMVVRFTNGNSSETKPKK